MPAPVGGPAAGRQPASGIASLWEDSEVTDATSTRDGPLASIVVIAYNEAARIVACLTALLAQAGGGPFEVIVVDDGSTDHTAAQVAQLAESHPNLRLIQQGSNRGRGASRRLGTELAGGELVGFVDADIEVPSNWLATLRMALETVDGASGVAVPDGDCAVVARVTGATVRPRPGTAEITGNNVLLRRAVFDDVAFDAEHRLGEDFRFAKYLTSAGRQLRTIDTLEVHHHETKTYLEGLRWMWQNGRDATDLLFEFRLLRTPDVAAVAWSAGTALAALGLFGGRRRRRRSLAAWLLGSTAIGMAFGASRFARQPRPRRFAAALVASVPMTTTYLAGRTWQVVRRLTP